MEALRILISSALLLALAITPIALYVILNRPGRTKPGFITYLIPGLILVVFCSLAFAWWMDYSDQLLMSHYGYDFQAMNDIDRFKEVKPENLQRVQVLESRYFGIGWPLRAIVLMAFSIPYLGLIYLIGRFITRRQSA